MSPRNKLLARCLTLFAGVMLVLTTTVLAAPNVCLIQTSTGVTIQNADSQTPVLWTGMAQGMVPSARTFKSFLMPGAVDSYPLTITGAGTFAPSLSGNITYPSNGAEYFWLENIYWPTPTVPNSPVYGFFHSENDRLRTPKCGSWTRYDASKGLAFVTIDLGVSTDQGQSWNILGHLLSAADADRNCNAQNGDFAGGNTDAGIAADPDPSNPYIYVFYTNTGGPVAKQGIGVARFNKSALNPSTVPAAYKWNGGTDWSVPGNNADGQPLVPLPENPPGHDWSQVDVRSPYAPQAHWNTSLKMYVLLYSNTGLSGQHYDGLSRSVAFLPNLSSPSSVRTLTLPDSTVAWLSEFFGLGPPPESTVLMGRRARYLVSAPGPAVVSNYLADFYDDATDNCGGGQMWTQDTDRDVTYGGGSWLANNNCLNSATKSCHYTTTGYATATIVFQGQGISVPLCLGRQMVGASFTLDNIPDPGGQRSTFFNGGDTCVSGAAYTSAALQPGTHTLVITNANSGKLIFERAIVVPNSTTQVLDDLDARFTYSPGYFVGDCSLSSKGAYLGCYHQDSAASGSSASVAFTGTKADVYLCRGSSSGNVSIAVDGQTPATVNTYQSGTVSCAMTSPVYTTPTLADGAHTLTVTNTQDGRTVYVDKVVVTKSGGSATATPTSSPTLTPTPTSTPNQGATSTPTATPTWTATPTQTSTPTATPTATPTGSGGGTNLLTNGGFETAVGQPGYGWSTSANGAAFVTQNGTLFTEGTHSMKISSSKGDTFNVYQDVPVMPGKTVNFAGQLDVPVVTGNFRVSVLLIAQNQWGGTINSAVSAGSVTATTGGWLPLTASMVVPANAATVRVEIKLEQLHADVYADAFSLKAP